MMIPYFFVSCSLCSLSSSWPTSDEETEIDFFSSRFKKSLREMTNVSERNPISQTWSWASRNYRTKASGERKTIAGLTFFNPSFFLSSLLTFLILHSKFEFVMFSSLPGDIEHWKNWFTSYIVHAKYAEAKAICTLATIFQLLFFTISDYKKWPYVRTTVPVSAYTILVGLVCRIYLSQQIVS